jgi:hypothetical protein
VRAAQAAAATADAGTANAVHMQRPELLAHQRAPGAGLRRVLPLALVLVVPLVLVRVLVHAAEAAVLVLQVGWRQLSRPWSRAAVQPPGSCCGWPWSPMWCCASNLTSAACGPCCKRRRSWGVVAAPADLAAEHGQPRPVCCKEGAFPEQRIRQAMPYVLLLLLLLLLLLPLLHLLCRRHACPSLLRCHVPRRRRTLGRHRHCCCVRLRPACPTATGIIQAPAAPVPSC